MENENIVDNAATMGSYMYEQLQPLYDHKIVGDIRGGKGLLSAVELVKDRESKEKFDTEFKLYDKLTAILQKHMILGRAGDTIPIAPPLCITKNEIDHFVSQLDSALTEIETQV